MFGRSWVSLPSLAHFFWVENRSYSRAELQNYLFIYLFIITKDALDIAGPKMYSKQEACHNKPTNHDLARHPCQVAEC